MITPVLFDQWLFLDINDDQGVYGKEEIIRNHKSKIKSVAAAVLGVSTKVMHFDAASLTQKEVLISQSFDRDHLILQEGLSANSVQLMAVKKEKVEEVCGYFGNTQITALVPYQVAIRAFFKSKGMLQDDKAIIFVDDLKNMAVVSIFNGSMISDSRQIAMRELEYMAGEIKRTWASYTANISKDISYILVSNNPLWLNEFTNLKLVSQEEVLHIDVAYPVLEGLKTAKFTNNFILPKDLARQKRNRLLHQRLINVGALVLFLTFSAGIYAASLFYTNVSVVKAKQMTQEAAEVNAQLATTYQKKIRGYLQSLNTQSIDTVYLSFLNHIPYGYNLKEINLINRDGWLFQALIVPGQYEFYGEFKQSDIWQDAIVTNERVGNQLGQRIELTLSTKEESL